MENKMSRTKPKITLPRSVYSTVEIALRWGKSEGFVRQKIARGELEAVRDGRLLHITPEAERRFFERLPSASRAEKAA
jgi:hypothetical protein